MPEPGDYVVVYGVSGRACWHCQRAMNAVEEVFGPFPADGWELVFTSSTGSLQLYRLGPDAVWPESASDGTPADGAGASDSGSVTDGSSGDEDGTDDPGP